MTTTNHPKTSRSYTTVAILAAVAAIAAAIVVFVLTQSGPSTPAGQFHVSIRGNLGATVTVDGKAITLRAETGYDSGDYTGREITVVASSSGDAPNCRITSASGVELASNVGADPTAPATEIATCTASTK